VENLNLWGESSDRDFRIRSRHSRQFYRFADKLLRSEVDLKRLANKVDTDAATIAALRSGIADARAGLQATIAEVEA
jgi:predicted transcriptional regulator